MKAQIAPFRASDLTIRAVLFNHTTTPLIKKKKVRLLSTQYPTPEATIWNFINTNVDYN